MNTSVKAVDLGLGDRFLFDEEVLTVAEPPQVTWGLVEIWVEEWDHPFEATDSTKVDLARAPSPIRTTGRSVGSRQAEQIATHGAPHPAARNPW
ncbi:MAG TPA: hypothetical protein VIQ76_04470 [Propionibacteriaceae bacterium]|jgi:hypothetical protein